MENLKAEHAGESAKQKSLVEQLVQEKEDFVRLYAVLGKGNAALEREGWRKCAAGIAEFPTPNESSSFV